MPENKIMGGQGMNYPTTAKEDAKVEFLGEVGEIHNDKIVMKNKIQTFSGVDPIPEGTSQENANSFPQDADNSAFE